MDKARMAKKLGVELTKVAVFGLFNYITKDIAKDANRTSSELLIQTINIIKNQRKES